MLIALIVIIGLSILILGHEAGHFAAAKIFGMRVDEFGFGFPPRLWAWRPFDKATGAEGETVYSVNALPFGGFVKIAGENPAETLDLGTSGQISDPEKRRYFSFQPAWRRSTVILAGVTFNFIFAWLIFTAIFAFGSEPSLIVSQVQSDSPAAAAGLRPGDVILGFENTEEFIAHVHANRGREITVEVSRAGEAMQFELTPRAAIGPNEGPIGIAFQGFVGRSLPQAAWDGLRFSWEMAKLIVTAFGSLIASIFTQATVPSDVVGIVGVFPLAQEVGRAGFVNVVWLVAIISLNLAVINLLPLPALDGGRLVLILLEKIKGSPLPRRVETWINATGFALLLLLMILITFKDIVQLVQS